LSTTNGPNPKRRRSPKPYRDSALLYGAFGVIVVVIAGLTGGNVLWAIVAAAGAFLLATGWTWRNLRARETEQRRR
jgi:drug/metabolite transporter (DMT)-like permease